MSVCLAIVYFIYFSLDVTQNILPEISQIVSMCDLNINMICTRRADLRHHMATTARVLKSLKISPEWIKSVHFPGVITDSLVTLSSGWSAQLTGLCPETVMSFMGTLMGTFTMLLCLCVSSNRHYINQCVDFFTALKWKDQAKYNHK